MGGRLDASGGFGWGSCDVMWEERQEVALKGAVPVIVVSEIWKSRKSLLLRAFALSGGPRGTGL